MQRPTIVSDRPYYSGQQPTVLMRKEQPRGLGLWGEDDAISGWPLEYVPLYARPEPMSEAAEIRTLPEGTPEP